MALTREFKNTVAARAQRDPRFREAIFTEALNDYFSGDTAMGKIVLRDLVNATVRFGNVKRGRESFSRKIAAISDQE